MGKCSVEQKEGEGQYWRTAVLNWLVREKGTLEQRCDESEGVGYTDVWEKSTVARSNPKVGMGLKCQRKSNKARMPFLNSIEISLLSLRHIVRTPVLGG